MNKLKYYIIMTLTTLGLCSCVNKPASSITTHTPTTHKTPGLTKVLEGEMLPMEYCLRTVSKLKDDTDIRQVLPSWKLNNQVRIDHCITETWKMLELKKNR
jgi:hypothetical protein